jgi:hypothetical protein
MNPKEPNSAVEVIYQGGDLEGYSMGHTDNNKIATEGLLELLAHLISEPAFDQLRTKEQLGEYYIHLYVYINIMYMYVCMCVCKYNVYVCISEPAFDQLRAKE